MQYHEQPLDGRQRWWCPLPLVLAFLVDEEEQIHEHVPGGQELVHNESITCFNVSIVEIVPTSSLKYKLALMFMVKANKRDKCPQAQMMQLSGETQHQVTRANSHHGQC